MAFDSWTLPFGRRRFSRSAAPQRNEACQNLHYRIALGGKGNYPRPTANLSISLLKLTRRRLDRPEAEARFRLRVQIGGSDRTRTCNQTVMSGRRSISLVDFSSFSFGFDRVHRVSSGRFWCETGAVILESKLTAFYFLRLTSAACVRTFSLCVPKTSSELMT
jgi:hypothetical protein